MEIKRQKHHKYCNEHKTVHCPHLNITILKSFLCIHHSTTQLWMRLKHLDMKKKKSLELLPSENANIVQVTNKDDMNMQENDRL